MKKAIEKIHLTVLDTLIHHNEKDPDYVQKCLSVAVMRQKDKVVQHLLSHYTIDSYKASELLKKMKKRHIYNDAIITLITSQVEKEKFSRRISSTHTRKTLKL